MESFSSTVMGGTNSSLSVWLGNTDGSVTLSPGSTLKDITVYGNYAANTASQPAADTLNGATLHIGNGANFIIRPGAGTIRPSDRIVVEGGMYVLMNHNAADTVTIASDIVGGAGVTQDSSITFRRSENLNLNISGNVDYAGTMQLDQASGGYGPRVTFLNNTVNLGGLAVNYCIGGFTLTNSQATIGTLSMSSNWASSSIQVNSGSVVNATNVRLLKNGTLSINTGAELNVTGTNSDHGTGRSFIVDNGSTLTLNGGLLTGSAALNLGYSGTGTFLASSARPTWAAWTSGPMAMEYSAGDSSWEAQRPERPRVNFGGNIVNFASGSEITLGMGTLGATANWSVTYNNEFTPSYITLAASNGSYVDTLDAGDKTTGRTITFNTGLTGSGKLTKIGVGTLVLNGAAKVPVPAEGETAAVPGFTGTVELREGALTVKDSSVIGQGTLLINGGLTVAVTSADGYSLDAGSTLGTINLDGGTATLAAALTLNGGSLSFGALSTDTAALTVNSVAGTGATALQIGLSSVTANTEYALLHGTGMTDTSMFTLGGSAAELYKATFTVSDDTLYVSLSDKDGLLRWKSGNWNTDTSNTAWDLDGTPTAYADGQTVYFSDGADVNKTVTIVGNVAPGKINVSGTDFIFAGDGSITGDTTLNLLDGASLTINNANSYSGNTVLYNGSKLVVGNAGRAGHKHGSPPGQFHSGADHGTWNGLGTRLNANSTGTLKLSGNASGTTTAALTGVKYDVGAGTTLTLSAGTYGNTITGAGSLISAAGTTVLQGDVNITGSYTLMAGANAAASWTLDSGASLTAGSFIGRNEYNGTTTLTVKKDAFMNITGTLRISRDGKGVMNIEQGGMVLAQTLDLGQNWAGSRRQGRHH